MTDTNTYRDYKALVAFIVCREESERGTGKWRYYYNGNKSNYTLGLENET